jgi:hypothetical protein
MTTVTIRHLVGYMRSDSDLCQALISFPSTRIYGKQKHAEPDIHTTIDEACM